MKSNNEFSWSKTRDDSLECARRYRHSQYTWREAFSEEPSPDGCQAWRLKQLTSLDLVLGKLLHTEANNCIQAVLKGRALPTPEQVAKRVRAGLRRVCETSTKDFRDFMRRPRKERMLRSIYYSGAFDAKEVARVTRKIAVCAQNLCELALWDEIRDMDGSSVKVYKDPLKVRHPAYGIIYAAPDLVLDVEGDLVIVDFKTGKVDEDTWMQTDLYGWIVPQYLNLPVASRTWWGRIVGLADGTDQIRKITPHAMAQAEERARRSIEAMRDLLADPKQNTPLPIPCFPLPRPDLRDRLCRQCPYQEACHGELQRQGGRGLARPLWRVIGESNWHV